MKTPRLFEPEVPIPEDLRDAVELWTAYKKEQFRFTYKPIALGALVKRMAALGPERAAAAVHFSMSCGWEGVFEEKKSAKGGGDSPPERYLPWLLPSTIAQWPYLDRHARAMIIENITVGGMRRL